MYDSKGNYSLINTEDIDLLSSHYWYQNSLGYWCNSPRKNEPRYYLHRFVMGSPKGKQVDHKDGIRNDNRKNELRVCTNQQNSWNKRPTAISGHKFVYKHSRVDKWFVTINRHYCGLYDTYEDKRQE